MHAAALYLTVGITLAVVMRHATNCCVCRRALEPMIVPRHQLHLATTLDTLAWSVTLAVGAALGGAFVSKLGTTASFCIDSVTYLIAAGCAWYLQVSITLCARHMPTQHFRPQGCTDGVCCAPHVCTYGRYMLMWSLTLAVEASWADCIGVTMLC